MNYNHELQSSLNEIRWVIKVLLPELVDEIISRLYLLDTYLSSSILSSNQLHSACKILSLLFESEKRNSLARQIACNEKERDDLKCKIKDLTEQL